MLIKKFFFKLQVIWGGSEETAGKRHEGTVWGDGNVLYID